jgi:hypothetical protein
LLGFSPGALVAADVASGARNRTPLRGRDTLPLPLVGSGPAICTLRVWQGYVE